MFSTMSTDANILSPKAAITSLISIRKNISLRQPLRYFISHALSSYYDLSVYGIYVRDVENFVLENFSVTPRQGNTRALTNFSA